MEQIRVHHSTARIEATEFNLEGSEFTKGTLRNSHPFHTEGATMRPVKFEDCFLAGSKFSNCNLSGVHITGCNISGMTINGISVEDLLAGR
jgi:uncharacterized protein YjbI with pentapeptide repeats